MPERVEVELGEVSRIRLNRPERKNAIDLRLLEELDAVLEEVRRERPRVVVLGGKGDTFCSGLDTSVLAELARWEEEKLLPVIDLAQRVIVKIRRMECPVVAACQRYAIGGGMQLALAADLRLATPGTVFFLREPEFGILPDMGALHLLPRIVGDGVAREFILAGRRMTAEEGERVGLVNGIFPSLEEGVRLYVERILSLQPLPLRESKALLESSWGEDLDSSMRKAKEAQLRCLRELRT
ncbi:MAG: enoyl-CoA hydratase/isomerase family protein [Candidatus Hadarchaeales archaeon]